MSTKRILDEQTASQVASDDYLYIDGQTNGSRKITPENIIVNSTIAQTLSQHISDAEDTVESLQSDITDVKSDLGDLSNLETEDKSSLVNAINEARETGGSGNGLTAEIKSALLQIARKVAYIDDDGQTYYDALEDALYPPANLVSISAVYAQSGTVYDTASLDDLKPDLVVTAHYDDSSTETVTTYTLSGTLAVGTSTITVAYGGKTTTFNVTVSQDASSIETITTLVNGTDWNYSTGQLSLSDGTVSENSGWYTSDFITVPDGSTSFARDTSRTSDWYLSWYDSEQAFLGNGLNGTYSGNSTYGDGYTDSDNVLWHVVPATAKYCKVSWRTSATYTSLSFKHNVKLDASKTPVVNKVYYYTYDATSTNDYTANDDYLKCEGMAYAQIRPVYRRGVTFYDADFIQVSTIATANNIGNNVEIPSGAVYLKCTNKNLKNLSQNNISYVGTGRIEFTDESLSTW